MYSKVTLDKMEQARRENRAAANAMAAHWLLNPDEAVTLCQAAGELGFTRAALGFWGVPDSWAVVQRSGIDGRRFAKFRRGDIYAVALASGASHVEYSRGSSNCAGRRVNAWTSFMRTAGRAAELPAPLWSVGRPPRQAVPA